MVPIADGLADLAGGGPVALDYERLKGHERPVLRRDEPEIEEALLLATKHREHPMRRRHADGLFPVEIVAILRAFRFPAGGGAAAECAVRDEYPARSRADVRVFAYLLRDDVPGPRQGFFG